MDPMELEYSLEANSHEEGFAIDVDASSSVMKIGTSGGEECDNNNNSKGKGNDNNGGGNMPARSSCRSWVPKFSHDLFSMTDGTTPSMAKAAASAAAADENGNDNAIAAAASPYIETVKVSSIAGSRAGAIGGGGVDSNADADANCSASLAPSDERDNVSSPRLPSPTNDDDDRAPSYYTVRPPAHGSVLRPSTLSMDLRLREYRHNSCTMAPLSYLVLFALLLSGLLGLLLSFPQLVIGLALGPLVRRNFWLVEFLYRYDVARWGHLSLMKAAGKRKGIKDDGDDREKKKKKKKKDGKGRQQSSSKKPPRGHSQTLQQRITIVPDRVYVHPMPQFVDNVSYLIVCTPPPTTTASTLPILGIVIDPGESDRILRHAEAVYERYYQKEYPPRNDDDDDDLRNGCGYIDIRAAFCTHRHHDHTAGVRGLRKELEARMAGSTAGRAPRGVTVNSGCAASAPHAGEEPYRADNFVVAGGAVESVPGCDLFVRDGCYVPLPCVSASDDPVGGEGECANDMNAVVSVEAIGVPSHTRGSVVYALRNRIAPRIPQQQPRSARDVAPLQSHLFTGDAIFTGGGGVPFEADMEFGSDNFVKNPKSLRKRNGNDEFRPGAGTLSMERCFVEVLTRAGGPWSEGMESRAIPQAAITHVASKSKSSSSQHQQPARTLLYPGHEYTTDLLMRQFDQKNLPPDIGWNRTSPATFFEAASHYLVSAHRRALPPDQKLLTIPTPLDKERCVNPNYRMLRRRGERMGEALRLWYEYGARGTIETSKGADDVAAAAELERKRRRKSSGSVFATVYSTDLDSVVAALRSGKLAPSAAADELESLTGKLESRLVGRRPIPSTLPSHKNVYLGAVGLAMLGSGPSAVTVSDARIMGLAEPAERTDRISISRSRLIAALDGLGLLDQEDASPGLADIIRLLWKEARQDEDNDGRTKKLPECDTDGGTTENGDIESSSKTSDDDDDAIELGLLKLALFGVKLDTGPAKFCMPCGVGKNKKPRYDKGSWVERTKLRRTAGELVRHDPNTCLACRDVLATCPYSRREVCTPV